MKVKIYYYIVLLCLTMGCKNEKQNKTESQNSDIVKDNEVVKAENLVKSKLPYQANYIMIKDTPSEDQFLQFSDGNIYYIGTSDDFDDAREGYLPGYFNTSVSNLKMGAGNFTFTLDASKIKFYKKQDALGISPPENEVWNIAKLKGKRSYRATINHDTIFIETKGFDIRKFVKTNAG